MNASLVLLKEELSPVRLMKVVWVSLKCTSNTKYILQVSVDAIHIKQYKDDTRVNLMSSLNQLLLFVVIHFLDELS